MFCLLSNYKSLFDLKIAVKPVNCSKLMLYIRGHNPKVIEKLKGRLTLQKLFILSFYYNSLP